MAATTTEAQNQNDLMLSCCSRLDSRNSQSSQLLCYHAVKLPMAEVPTMSESACHFLEAALMWWGCQECRPSTHHRSAARQGKIARACPAGAPSAAGTSQSPAVRWAPWRPCDTLHAMLRHITICQQHQDHLILLVSSVRHCLDVHVGLCMPCQHSSSNDSSTRIVHMALGRGLSAV